MADHITLLVGCPVWKRLWTYEKWFNHIEVAAAKIGIKPQYVFAASRDDEAVQTLEDLASQYRSIVTFRWIEEDPDRSDKRVWNHDRFHHMVHIRNELLDAVRRLSPAYFLSLDSDIYVHERSLVSLFDVLFAESYDAVGGKCYMTPTRRTHPSYAYLHGRNVRTLARPESNKVLEVDVIMAMKLMTPQAYQVDYEFDPLGEDVGWCRGCTERGLRLGWDGRITNKHCMSPEAAEDEDERCRY